MLKGNFFNICVLSQCIMYWIKFQNIHTFTYQKTLLYTLFCLFLKSLIALNVSVIIIIYKEILYLNNSTKENQIWTNKTKSSLGTIKRNKKNMYLTHFFPMFPFYIGKRVHGTLFLLKSNSSFQSIMVIWFLKFPLLKQWCVVLLLSLSFKNVVGSIRNWVRWSEILGVMNTLLLKVSECLMIPVCKFTYDKKE